MLTQLWNDECGVVISAELVLILSVAVLTMVVGLSELSSSIIMELNDVSNAVGALNQTFGVTGYASMVSSNNGKVNSFVTFSGFQDCMDQGDANVSGDIVMGIADASYTVTAGG